ncbi:hypothetical protein Q4Q35_06765 [Flavivirga aquimarina]|uniref:Polysaccharide chain length determinant N-terminal domain-containing protein n=1 Tax=Flavivirga aquimarina TaxID=2027862 RepID=A0ABT8W8W5_9FLAO|nr:hypothetical protein [Flavivirga aquimarina]MDO5969502.1 hypothetical protein [Flavivirga aquimarina]
MSKDLPQPPQQSEEVDLGQLFKLIGNVFSNFFRFIGSIFNKLFLAFVWLVFFVKKHVLKLAIAGIVGVILGIVLEKTSEPVYKSSITVKQNYNTGENLYNVIDYYNDLIKQDVNILKTVLGVKSEEAESILNFEIEPTISENQKLQEFHAYLKTLDTSLTKILDYKTFLKNSKDYHHQYQQITIKAKERNNFKTVFHKIISNINSNVYFKQEQEKDLRELKAQASAIFKGLIKSDTLLAVYQKAIVKSAENNNDSQTQITIANKGNQSSTKEFELYNKDLELRRELVEIEREIADKKHIIEITSSKQDSGTIDDKKELFGIMISPKLFYAIILTMFTFIVLLGFNVVKFLERYKDKI